MVVLVVRVVVVVNLVKLEEITVIAMLICLWVQLLLLLFAAVCVAAGGIEI